MKSFQISAAAALSLFPFLDVAHAALYSGTPVGFAAAATGGGDAATVTPTTVAELTSYLTDSEPRNILISGTFDFTGTEGTATYPACEAYSCTPDNGGQLLLNTLEGCGDLSTYDITLDAAGVEGINVASYKTLVGTNNAVLNGKGLRFVGVENIIVQNIEITNLNPQYVWGGDALTFDDCSLIWIDHVTTSSLGRQHYAFGEDSDSYVTISNSFINGVTAYSATCDNHTYWGMELVGSDDSITFYQNYVYYTSGRSPALSGTTIFHAVNSVWEDNSGHAIEGTDSGMSLFEGCIFTDVTTIVQDDFVGSLFSSNSADVSQCESYLGRSCETNIYTDSGAFDEDDYSWFSELADYTIAPAAAASAIASSVPASAGATL